VKEAELKATMTLAEYNAAVKAQKQRATPSRSAVPVSPSPALERPRPPSSIAIFVGPQTRDGFVDVDSGVLDSIKDLETELRGKPRFHIAANKEAAQIVLEVISRGATSASGGGAVAMPIGTSTFFIPVGTIGMATLLHVGTYEKPIVFQNCGSWRYCARLVVKDLEAWTAANAAAITPR
jgi:hypothetical protein